MNRHKRYPPEVRERAVRLVLEHQENYHSQWAALTSIAGWRQLLKADLYYFIESDWLVKRYL